VAKRRKKTRRPPSGETERLRLTNTQPEEDADEDRAEILAQLPAWARLLRTRGGIAVGAALVGGIIAYNVLGTVAGPAAAGLLLIGTGLALWRADVLERRVRRAST
jgi:hypothetical protein